MLPRSRSLFEIEEFGEEYKGSSTSRSAGVGGTEGNSRRPVMAGKVDGVTTTRHGMRDPKSSKSGRASPVGLRILIHRPQRESNIVNNSILIQRMTINHTASPELDFLKTCLLCKKLLSPDKDVYMYRGDQGFCSVECRCRQIMLEEMEEDEAYFRGRRERLVQSPICRRGNRIREPTHYGVRRRGIPAIA